MNKDITLRLDKETHEEWRIASLMEGYRNLECFIDSIMNNKVTEILQENEDKYMSIL